MTINTIYKPRIGVYLAHIPSHNASEARKPLTIRNNRRKRRTRLIAAPSSAGRARDPEEDFNSWVQRHGLSPVIPRVKIEVVLRRGAGDKRLQAAIIVVKLHPDGVEEDLPIQHRIVRRIRIRALRSGCEEPLLAACGRVGVHEAAELVREGNHVGDAGLKVEIEAVDGGGAEWAVGGGAGDLGAKHRPDIVGCVDGGCGIRKAAFGVCCSSDGK